MRASGTRVTISAMAALALTLTACGTKSNGGGGTETPPPQTATTPAPGGGGGGGATTPATPATSPTGTGAAAASFKACMVLDTGGIDDKSFNESSWGGLQAAARVNSKIAISYVPSNSSNDYTPNLTAMTTRRCDTIIAVGGLMADNVKAIASANPHQHYAEVDNPSTGPNVYGIQFNTAQGAFLGGYLAAGMTKTGKVGTWGGDPIPSVTIYMDGFWEGVQYYNHQHHKDVQVLGWDEHNQKGGTFTNSFTDQNMGKSISETMIQQGADIIFPVAGGAGIGAISAAQASNGHANVIWVDTDGCISLGSQDCKVLITSVTKGLTTSVQTYALKAASGTFPTGSYVGTLANGGTGLAPYHDFASQVPEALKKELAQVKADIISGKIKITSPSQPHA